MSEKGNRHTDSSSSPTRPMKLDQSQTHSLDLHPHQAKNRTIQTGIDAIDKHELRGFFKLIFSGQSNPILTPAWTTKQRRHSLPTPIALISPLNI